MTMISDLTAKYFEAKNREGSNFDYLGWFRGVQDQNRMPSSYQHQSPRATLGTLKPIIVKIRRNNLMRRSLPPTGAVNCNNVGAKSTLHSRSQ